MGVDYILSFDIGTKNLAYCLLGPQEKILDWGVRDIDASSNLVQTKRLYVELNRIDLKDYTVDVVIEKQPSFNPKMRVISDQVYFYYVSKMMEIESLFKIRHITYYSPRKKLSSFKLMENEEVGSKKYKSKYAQRKYLAKEYCRILLERTRQELWSQHFKEKPSADLADSYLQAVAYMKEKK